MTYSHKICIFKAHYDSIIMTENEISSKIIGAAINVHKALGPGLLESTYETCLAYELKELGLKVNRQLALPVIYIRM